MIGWASQWTALVLLLLCAATTAIKDLTIAEMDWSYDEATVSTSWRVCTVDDLDSSSYTLELSPNPSGYEWPTSSNMDTKCVTFSNEGNGKLPPPAELTAYKLTSTDGFIHDSGSVSFALEGASFTCGSVPFLRFNTAAETVVGDICVSLDSVCYVAEENIESGQICFTGLDESHLEFQVCTEKEAFSALDSYGGSLTTDVLTYVDGSFTFTFDSDDPSLPDLLILPDGSASSATAVSCDANYKCADATSAQSTTKYNLCGVFVDANGKAVSSGEVPFQDTELIVDVVPNSAIDFHFMNLHDDKLYLVSGLDSEYNLIGDEFSLDCSHITTDTICNGFFDENLEEIMNIEVSYDEGNDVKSNTIIAPVSP